MDPISDLTLTGHRQILPGLAEGWLRLPSPQVWDLYNLQLPRTDEGEGGSESGYDWLCYPGQVPVPSLGSLATPNSNVGRV